MKCVLDKVKKKPILLKGRRTPEDELLDTDLIVPSPDDIYKRQLDTTCTVLPSGHAGLYLGTDEKKIHCDLKKKQPGGATKKKFKEYNRHTHVSSEKLDNILTSFNNAEKGTAILYKKLRIKSKMH